MREHIYIPSMQETEGGGLLWMWSQSKGYADSRGWSELQSETVSYYKTKSKGYTETFYFPKFHSASQLKHSP